MGSLCEFNVLSSLEIDWNLLVRYIPDSNILTGALPPSIQKLHLHVNGQKHHYYKPHIHDLLVARENSFSELKEILLSKLTKEGHVQTMPVPMDSKTLPNLAFESA